MKPEGTKVRLLRLDEVNAAASVRRHRLAIPGADFTIHVPDVGVGSVGVVTRPLAVADDLFEVRFARAHIACNDEMVEVVP